MNATIAKALLEDAWRQVVDNKVFRLLVILVLVPIATSFLIGFHQDRIELLWGWREVPYDRLTQFLGPGGSHTADLRAAVIQAFQAGIVSFFGGFVGVIFCISATAFFVPRMMEKGAADMLFSKPVGRFTLLLSRYVAGILFVGTLAFLLVLGMYAGFRIVSGYDDPGFLWGALTLVYLYGILYAFTIAVATVTRSSTAAILLSLILFLFSGCIHRGWMFKEFATEQRVASELEDQAEAETPKSEAQIRAEGAADNPAFVNFLLGLLDALHYALPKTTEAAILTEKLKRDLARRPPVFEEPEAGLYVQDAPEDFVRGEGTGEGVLAAWTKPSAGGGPPDRVLLRREARTNAEGRRILTSRRAQAMQKELASSTEDGTEPALDETDVAGRTAPRLRWTEARDGGRVLRERVFFSIGDWFYVADFELDANAWKDEQRDRLSSRFLRGWSLDVGGPSTPDEWLERRFEWDAPLRYNLFFSIGSSLAFALLMLAIAGLELRRADF